VSTITTELSKAIASLEQAISLYKHAVENSPEQKAFRDACIQRFEYSLEFCWKVSMKALGSTMAAAKPAVREMARNNLITNPSEWIDFVEVRNNTSHSYDEDVAKKVFVQIEKFFPCAKELLTELQNIKK
jgi:nucleotidyltransferase substrate binding protein (TIGR01987 family)